VSIASGRLIAGGPPSPAVRTPRVAASHTCHSACCCPLGGPVDTCQLDGRAAVVPIPRLRRYFLAATSCEAGHVRSGFRPRLHIRAIQSSYSGAACRSLEHSRQLCPGSQSADLVDAIGSQGTTPPSASIDSTIRSRVCDGCGRLGLIYYND